MKKIESDSRRRFIKKMIALSVAAGYFSCANSVEAVIKTLAKGKLPTRPFGNTGFDVGLFSLGGQATVEIPGKDEEALEIINRAIDLGVNYIDTSAYYGRANHC